MSTAETTASGVRGVLLVVLAFVIFGALAEIRAVLRALERGATAAEIAVTGAGGLPSATGSPAGAASTSSSAPPTIAPDGADQAPDQTSPPGGTGGGGPGGGGDGGGHETPPATVPPGDAPSVIDGVGQVLDDVDDTIHQTCEQLGVTAPGAC